MSEYIIVLLYGLVVFMFNKTGLAKCLLVSKDTVYQNCGALYLSFDYRIPLIGFNEA